MSGSPMAHSWYAASWDLNSKFFRALGSGLLTPALCCLSGAAAAGESPWRVPGRGRVLSNVHETCLLLFSLSFSHFTKSPPVPQLPRLAVLAGLTGLDAAASRAQGEFLPRLSHPVSRGFLDSPAPSGHLSEAQLARPVTPKLGSLRSLRLY